MWSKERFFVLHGYKHRPDNSILVMDIEVMNSSFNSEQQISSSTEVNLCPSRELLQPRRNMEKEDALDVINLGEHQCIDDHRYLRGLISFLEEAPGRRALCETRVDAKAVVDEICTKLNI
ncbi:hypothetical protein ACOME3_006285 [Neoechinorhynchus agilis]